MRAAFLAGALLAAPLAGCVIDAPHYVLPDDDASPNCVPGCSGDDLVTCDTGEPVTTTCPLGCGVFDQVEQCATMVPSNGVPLTDLDGVTSGINVPAGWQIVISTNDGAIYGVDNLGASVTLRDSGENLQGGLFFHAGDGPNPVSVLALESLTVEQSGLIRVRGPWALAILSRGDVSINGIIDASAEPADVTTMCPESGTVSQWSCPGPGGGRGGDSIGTASGCGTGGGGIAPNTTSTYPGGGGGAFATAGGNAGNSSGANGGLGGTTASCPGPTLEPLVGGSGGGFSRSLASGSTSAEGGSAGGALQITSLTAIELSSPTAEASTTFLDVTGFGGQRTFNWSDGTSTGGGGGGGAGGGVLLEAPGVTISNASIFGGGGGGGAGDLANPPVGSDGEEGHRDDAVAGGGSSPASSGGDGGDGAAFANGSLHQAGVGQGSTAGHGTGGGGGGAGMLRINNHTGTLDLFTATITATWTIGNVGVE